MDLFYRVDTDEMLDKSQFGDIMLQVQNFLYKQHGIKLSNFVCDIDELLEKKFEGMEILNEEFNVIHISQLLNKLIKEGKINPEKENITVTYHDPCHLCRHAEESEAPREVIKTVANLTEMPHIKDNALCCGSGGGVKSAYGDLSNDIAKTRMDEAKETNADLLVTACPFCKLNLSSNSDMEVLDLSEFIYNNLKKKGEANE